MAKKSEVIKSDYFGKLVDNKLYTIITFDDGFENLIENAIPVLKEYKLPFTIFFISSYFGKIPDWEFPSFHPDQNEKIMTIEQMNDLPDELTSIGSHTAHHKNLTSISEDELVLELEESKNILEELSNKSVDTISFPNGEYNNMVIRKSFEVGYKRVFTIEPIPALIKEDEKITGRIWVNGNDWYLEFWLKLNGAYSWLNYAFKFKSIIKDFIKL
ncbi:MAG: polysaccharide deacetylase family protein [Ignavibacteriae bacterium]|nr:polysaccharide deacetylase family protein [Ignavibacteriota bacterium]